MFGTSIHFFPKQVLPVMGSYFILLLALAVSGCLVPLFSCFMAPVVSSCLCLLRWLPLVASGCPGRLWLLGLLFFSGCLRPCWVLWLACVGMLFLLLSRAVHGSWVHVLKLAGFTYEAHEGFWCLRPKEWWYGRVSGCTSFYSALLVCWAARFAASFYVFGSPCSIQLFRVAGAVSFSCLGGLRWKIWKQNGACR